MLPDRVMVSLVVPVGETAVAEEEDMTMVVDTVVEEEEEDMTMVEEEEDAGKFPFNPLCRDFNVRGD